MKGVTGPAGIQHANRGGSPSLQTRGLLARRKYTTPLPLGHREHRPTGVAPEFGGCLLSRTSRLLQHVLLGRYHMIDPTKQCLRPWPSGAAVDDAWSPRDSVTFVERRARRVFVGRSPGVRRRRLRGIPAAAGSCAASAIGCGNQMMVRVAVCPCEDDGRVLRRLVEGYPPAIDTLGSQPPHQDLGMLRLSRTPPEASSWPRVSKRRSRLGPPAPLVLRGAQRTGHRVCA